MAKGVAGVNVLVTGGARRIGRAIVEDLAAHGFGVAIHCNRSRSDADGLCDAIVARGGRAVVVTADLADPVAAGALVGDATNALGPLSIVVNNASVFEDDSLYDLDWQRFERHFAVHVKAPAAITAGFAALVPEDSHGLVVNVVDQRVLRPNPRFFSYTLSKSALWTATQTMAQALAPRIRVNAIGPGPSLRSPRQDEEAFAAQARNVLLGRGPELGEFGATIRYLWQAKSITGQLIALDGGQHLAWETPDVAGISE